MGHSFLQVSDLSSELSSPSSSLMDVDFGELSMPAATSSEAVPKPLNPRFSLGVSANFKPSFEKLPYELIEKIASILPSDSDIRNLALTSAYFAAAILPSWSGVWRSRFLYLYDYPIIENTDEFRFAYQIRRLTTKAFVDFEDGAGEQGLECLETLKDMVMEAYHVPRLSASIPTHSKNLKLFAQPAPYIDKFLAQPLYACRRNKYGQPHAYFDTLQLCLSHVMLSPRSYAAIKSNSRENFDAQRVYKFNQRFQTIYHCSEGEQGPETTTSWSPALCLNLYDLLHIRNFWNRHLCSIDENTYHYMASKLAEMGREPPSWNSPLKPVESDFVLPEKWIGHYSCVHPFPKKMSDLQDASQTCGEDWPSVEPLTLDFVTSSKHAKWFPQIFANIPVLKRTLPNSTQLPHKISPSKTYEHPIKFFRGVAPFISFLSSGKASLARANEKLRASHIHTILNETDLVPGLTIADLSKPDTAPYAGLRVRGMAYPINAGNTKDQGYTDAVEQVLHLFTRVVFVLYKPTDLYLLTTAENWKHIQETKAILNSSNVLHQSGPVKCFAISSTSGGDIADDDFEGSAQFGSLSKQKAVTSRSKKAKKMKTTEEYKPLPNRSLIIKQEDAYHRSTQTSLKWDDIEYAYAYEGSILPGGKIQMGRWWRCDPWIAREGGLAVPAGLFEPNDGQQNEDDGDLDGDDMPAPFELAFTDGPTQVAPPPTAAANQANQANTAAPTPGSIAMSEADPSAVINQTAHETHGPQQTGGQLPASPTLTGFLMQNGVQPSQIPHLAAQGGILPSGVPLPESYATQLAALQSAIPSLQQLAYQQTQGNNLPPLDPPAWNLYHADHVAPTSSEQVSSTMISEVDATIQSLKEIVQSLQENGGGIGGDPTMGSSGNGENTNGSGNVTASANATWTSDASLLGQEFNVDANHPLATIWDEDAVPKGERGPFVFWVDRKADEISDRLKFAT